MLRGKLKRCAIPLALAGLPTGVASADPLMFDIGPVLVRPTAAVQEMYDDNVTYQHTNPKGDFITSVTPGLGLSIGEKEWNHIIVNYSIPNRIYAGQSSLDYTGQNLALDGLYQGGQVTVKALENYTASYGILGGATVSAIAVGSEAYHDAIEIGYEISPKTSLYSKTVYDAIEFQQSSLNLIDYASYQETFGAGYHYSPKTSFFLEMYGGEVLTHVESFNPSPTPPRANYYGMFTGVQGQLGSRLIWYAKGGYEIRDFSNGTSAPGAIVAELDLTYNFNSWTRLDLRYRRANQSSINYIGINYVTDQVGAAVTRKFGKREKLETSLGVDYTSFAYQGATYNGRTDTPITASADVKYHFNDWLMADLAYQFLSFSSTEPESVVRSYEVNRISLTMTLGYTEMPKQKQTVLE